MKVRIEIVLDINPNAYNAEYGTKTKPREIARDVKDAVFGVVEAAFPHKSGIIVDSKLVNR